MNRTQAEWFFSFVSSTKRVRVRVHDWDLGLGLAVNSVSMHSSQAEFPTCIKKKYLFAVVRSRQVLWKHAVMFIIII
jgi:hypothetical protein